MMRPLGTEPEAGAIVGTVLRVIGRIILWSFAVVGGILIVGGIAAALSWRFLPEIERQRLPDSIVLEFNTGDGIVEKLSDSPLAWAAAGDIIALPDLVRGLDAGSRDPRVKGVLVHLGAGDLGLAQVQEIRDAVLDFRRQGKFAIAFAETFGEAGNGNIHYYLATAFDTIYMQPSGDIDLTGFRLETPFLEDAMDAIGVTAEMDRRAEYKSAMETFTEPALTEPSRENLQRLVDSWADQLAAGIAATRPGFDQAEARSLIDSGPYMAPDALAQGLVEGLLYWNAVESETDKRSAGATRIHLLDYVAAQPAPPADAPLIAVIHGIGPVTLATSESDPLFGTVTMGSDTVAGALRQAIDDPEVAAILFRIDSPGGSYVAADTIWAEVQRARELGKPVVVSMGNVAGSGGYFVAAPARAIIAQPGTITGSIGVFGGKFVLAGLWDKLGIHWDGVQAGANAGHTSFNQPFTEAGWAQLQSSLDRIYADFTGKVAQGRDIPPARVDQVARGQVWSGADAKELGLVDEVGGYLVAIARAREAAGIGPEAPVRVETYPRHDRPFAELLRDLMGSGLINQGVRARLALLSRLAAILEPAAEMLAPLADGDESRTLRMRDIRPAQ
jgi:protease-4